MPISEIVAKEQIWDHSRIILHKKTYKTLIKFIDLEIAFWPYMYHKLYLKICP